MSTVDLPGSDVRCCGSPLGADGEGPMWAEEPPLAVGFDGAGGTGKDRR